jgi:DNA-binding transcriptional LysR family regulator
LHVTLGQIRAFVTVASTGNFTRAADILHLSQPALTNRIRQFEDTLGLRLFDRHTRAVELTTLGRDLLPTFRRLCGEFETAVAKARESATRAKGIIRLACLPSCAASLLPDLIRDFLRDFPEVSFVVRDVINSQVAALVRSSEVDFGVSVRGEAQSDLEWTTLFNDNLQAVYRNDDPCGKTTKVTAAALARQPLILMTTGSSVRNMVDEAFSEAGLVAEGACEVNYIATAVALVQAGLGVAVLPSTAVEVNSQAGVVSRPIAGPGFTRDIALLRRKGSTLHPSAAAFVARLEATACI